MNEYHKYDMNLYRDSFQNYKVYQIPKAQLIIADVPYNLGTNAYGSNSFWLVLGIIMLYLVCTIGFIYLLDGGSDGN